MNAKYFAALLLLLGFAAPEPIRAGVPQPSYTLYGLVSDAFGWPYVTNATVTLWINGISNQAQIVTGMIAPGVNFKFQVDLDSGLSGTRYSAKAARAGDIAQITLTADGFQKTVVSSTPLPPIGGPGQIRAINLTTGTDADGDGIPDEWEQWIIQIMHNPAIQNIADILPNGDGDGDGVSNIDEYRAGTDPASAKDYFFLEQTELASNGRLQFRFLTIPGKTYHIMTTDVSQPGAYRWEEAAYATSPDANVQSDPIIGTGHFVSVFVPLQNAPHIFQARVQ